jgi:Flp pilus assembly protein TadD
MGRSALLIAAAVCLLGLPACSAFRDANYGAGAQAQRQLFAQASADKEPTPDNAGVYLNLITRMQAQGLYFASLAHIDAYEQQYGAIPDTVLLRADALRETGQPAAAKAEYRKLLKTPLAAEGYHGLGLLAGGSGDFAGADAPLARATELAPINAGMLSDLGYARMRAGNLALARVPLLKAAELDQKNQKIMSNLALYLLASDRWHDAQAFMTRENFSPQVREAVEADAVRVSAAVHAREAAEQRTKTRGGAPSGAQSPNHTVDPRTGSDLPARMLERFAPAAH